MKAGTGKGVFNTEDTPTRSGQAPSAEKSADEIVGVELDVGILRLSSSDSLRMTELTATKGSELMCGPTLSEQREA